MPLFLVKLHGCKEMKQFPRALFKKYRTNDEFSRLLGNACYVQVSYSPNYEFMELLACIGMDNGWESILVLANSNEVERIENIFHQLPSRPTADAFGRLIICGVFFQFIRMASKDFDGCVVLIEDTRENYLIVDRAKRKGSR